MQSRYNVLKKLFKKINHKKFLYRSKKTSALIRKLSNNKKIISILDIGAGNRYLKTLLNFDGSSNIYMVDPNKNLEWAVNNLKKDLNFPENVKGFKCGISDKSGKKKFFLASTSTGSTFINVYKKKNKDKINKSYFGPKNTTTTDVYSLKDFIKKFNLNKPDIIKIDVEGFEKKIIRSILKNFKPMIIEIELNNNHPLYGDTFSVIHANLIEANYELVTFVPNFGKSYKPYKIGNDESPIYRSTVKQIDCIYIKKKMQKNIKNFSILMGYGLIDQAKDLLEKNIKNKLSNTEIKTLKYLESLTKKI